MHVPQDRVREPLYVITPIFNPMRFKSRWKLYRDFQKRVRDAGAVLVTVEAAYGARDFALEHHASSDSVPPDGVAPVPTMASSLMPRSREDQEYIKVRAADDVWLKENLINLGIQHLPHDAQYIAWIDADTQFVRPDWVSETLHLLQRYDWLQMWSRATDLSPAYEPIAEHLSYAYCALTGMPRPIQPFKPSYYYGGKAGKGKWEGAYLWHPGFAWAARRSALDTVGGLMDFAILGAADNHMAHALFGNVLDSCHPHVSPSYWEAMLDWQTRALKLKQNVGFMDGTILHYWHGKKIDRRYYDRWQILIKHEFDPYRDIRKDWRGVLHLTGDKPAMRDALRAYFRQRNEDSIDL